MLTDLELALLGMLAAAVLHIAILLLLLGRREAELRAVYDKPLEYWERLHRNRRMMDLAAKAMLKDSKRWLKSKPLDRFPEGSTVKFRMPKSFTSGEGA